ncbi:hypothetical protein SLS60_002410 [Paraconiothyrium brasiliense]|uniref:Cytochrome P450 n=1 Tax=Paraconiothyrium brasiliense TaxID=300254 RepID=A0ABR3S242_9PLEO
MPLRQQNPIIQKYANLFMERLERELQKSTNLDITKFYGYLSLDIIGDLSIGKSFHGLEDENEHSWLDAFWMGVSFGSLRTSLARFHPLELVFGVLFLSVTRKRRAKNWRYVTESITERLHQGSLESERWDFLTPVLGNVNEGKEKGITRSELDGNTLAMIIAGCEVSTVALSATTYFLLRNLSTVDRLTKEVRASFHHEAEIDVGSTLELPYLNAVINEGLRMHHPTPSPLPRVVPAEGMTIAGKWIPGGVSIPTKFCQNQNTSQGLTSSFRRSLESALRLYKQTRHTSTTLIASIQNDGWTNPTITSTRASGTITSKLASHFPCVSFIVL